MPVFKYRDPQTGEWINIAGGGGAGESVDAYTKEETLSEETKTTFGLGTDAVPDEAFNVLKTLVDSNTETITSGAKISTGSYKGTGTYGSSNKNSLTFDFAPKFLVVAKNGNQTGSASGGSFYWVYPSTGSVNITKANEGYTPSVSVSGNTVSWYSDAAATQLNTSGTTYHYFAIG